MLWSNCNRSMIMFVKHIRQLSRIVMTHSVDTENNTPRVFTPSFTSIESECPSSAPFHTTTLAHSRPIGIDHMSRGGEKGEELFILTIGRAAVSNLQSCVKHSCLVLRITFKICCCPPQKCTLAQFFSQPFLKTGRNDFILFIDIFC